MSGTSGIMSLTHKYSFFLSYLYHEISANGFPPAALQTKVTVWPRRIVSPSMYPVISGGPGGSAIYKLAITHQYGSAWNLAPFITLCNEPVKREREKKHIFSRQA